MAYSIAWDALAPVGATTDADTIDTELQNLKTSIQERMNNVLSNDWETDANDPKTLDVTAIAGTQDRARVYINGATNLATGTPTAVVWDTETFDVGALWTVASPTRLTTVTDGYHRISAMTTLTTATAGGPSYIFIRKNGTTELARFYSNPDAASQIQSHFVSVIDDATAGDYYEVIEEQQSGGTWAHTIIGTGAPSNYFEIDRLAA